MGKDAGDELIFDSSRFYTPQQEIERQGGKSGGARVFIDGSDAYANNGMVLGFHHTPSGKNVYFKAFITAFNETYNSDWSSEVVYGRADPIAMFKNTTRSITLGFKAPAASISEAYENLANVGFLTQFLYPYYTGNGEDATTIAQSPLVRIKVMNLLANQSKTSEGKKFTDFIDSAGSYSAADGLLGYITSVSINHNLETQEAGVLETNQGVILPKLIEVTIDFQAIHEHVMGWTTDENGAEDPAFRHPSFPYGLDLEKSSGDPRTIKEKISDYAALAEKDRLAAIAEAGEGGEALEAETEAQVAQEALEQDSALATAANAESQAAQAGALLEIQGASLGGSFSGGLYMIPIIGEAEEDVDYEAGLQEAENISESYDYRTGVIADE